jgi:hypothetical protein
MRARHIPDSTCSATRTALCSAPVTMSDYDDYDDYDNYGADFFYVEDEYTAADDLAEHAVPSPPPTTCGDEDMQEDWDRFDYFNDLEYASDGYDDATFRPHPVKGARAGLKRKRAASTMAGKKRTATAGALRGHSPVVWRSHADRDSKPKTLDDNAPSYALFRDWRESLADTPHWARASPPCDDGLDEDGMEAGEESIPKEALLAALHRQMAAAGGPLGGMHPQQLLEYAMRMASGGGAGDDIAGEMADAMLEGEDEEDDADAEEKLLSWVAQQRNGNREAAEHATHDSNRPPTPPLSKADRSVRVCQNTTRPAAPHAKKGSLKRKADDADGESATKVDNKRVTRSFNAPTASSQAKAASTRTTRTKPGKRP